MQCRELTRTTFLVVYGITLQPKVARMVQQLVSYVFIWIRRTCDIYLVECSLLRAV